MPGADEVLAVEARLIDNISRQTAKMGQKVNNSFDKMGDRAKKSGKKVEGSFSKMKSGVVDFAKRFGPAAIAVALLTGALMALGRAIDFVNEKTSEFEKTMSSVKAILKPTSSEFSALSEEAKRLGETTAFSASQAGQAFVEMGKLGFTAGEIIASTSDVLNLAALSGASLAESSEVVVKTLNQFNLTAESAGALTDIMAKSFTTTALDMDKFRESMKFVGTSARLAGLSIEQTTAILGVMADNGLEASTAGTSLNQMLIQMVKPGSKASKIFDKLGIGSESVMVKMKALAASGMDVGEIFALLDVRAGRAANVIFENIDALDGMSTGFKNARGEGKKMADTMLDNVAGATTILKSAQEGLGIALGEAFSSEKRKRIELYTRMINFATSFVKEHRDVIESTAMVFSGVFRGSLEAVILVFKSFDVVLSTIKAGFFGMVTVALKSLMKLLQGASKVKEFFGGDPLNLDLLTFSVEEFKKSTLEASEHANQIFAKKPEGEDRFAKAVKDMKMLRAEQEAVRKSEQEAQDAQFSQGLAAQKAAAREAEKEQDKLAKEARKQAEKDEKEAFRVIEQEHSEFLSQTSEGRIQLLQEEDAKKRALLMSHVKDKGVQAKALIKLEANTTRKIGEETKKEIRMRQALRNAWLSTTASILGALGSIAGAIGVSAKTVQKFALGEAIVNTALAIARANALPPPLNIPAIIRASAVGGAQIATIASQAFETGGLPRGRNANILVNERGQESVLNARATGELGVGGVNALNSGQTPTTSVSNQISYSPNITVNGGSDAAGIIEALSQDKESFSEFFRDEVIGKGY